jgi:hypothetical protein
LILVRASGSIVTAERAVPVVVVTVDWAIAAVDSSAAAAIPNSNFFIFVLLAAGCGAVRTGEHGATFRASRNICLFFPLMSRGQIEEETPCQSSFSGPFPPSSPSAAAFI